jgi:hypothetical protein
MLAGELGFVHILDASGTMGSWWPSIVKMILLAMCRDTCLIASCILVQCQDVIALVSTAFRDLIS